MQEEFDLLRKATRYHCKDTLHYALVNDWQSKREIVAVLLDELTTSLSAYENVVATPYAKDSRINVTDPIPRVRLMAFSEATVNALYGLGDLAANFASKTTKQLPASFNKICTKINGGNVDEPLSKILGDLTSYEKIREIRTEWTHHSTVFIVTNDNNETALTIGDYRRPTDKQQFTVTSFFTIAELIAWANETLETLDAFAQYLAEHHVLPKFDPDKTIISDVLDENGVPKMLSDGRFATQQITMRKFFADCGIELDTYVNTKAN